MSPSRRFAALAAVALTACVADGQPLDRSFQTDARAKPARPEAGVASDALVAAALPAAAATPAWRDGSPAPLARTEVAAGLSGAEILVVGGFVAAGQNSVRADAYAPRADRWRRVRDFPVPVDHAAAASYAGRIIVAGGYGRDRRPLRTVFTLIAGRWRSLPPLPEARAAAAATVARGTLYVVGGVAPGGLARRAFALDLRRLRGWRTIPSPTPREHLAAAAYAGRVYALAGRVGGTAGNLPLLESWAPGERIWRPLPPVPEARSGTGAAVVGREIVSVGGEATTGTIAGVYAYDPARRRWRRLPDLPTPRHGLGVVATLGRVYALAGGPEPGLHVSAVNEFLPLR